jgi:hypothetical protein
MKTISFLAIALISFDASANYHCVKTKDGVLVCRPIVKTF